MKASQLRMHRLGASTFGSDVNDSTGDDAPIVRRTLGEMGADECTGSFGNFKDDSGRVGDYNDMGEHARFRPMADPFASDTHSSNGSNAGGSFCSAESCVSQLSGEASSLLSRMSRGLSNLSLDFKFPSSNGGSFSNFMLGDESNSFGGINSFENPPPKSPRGLRGRMRHVGNILRGRSGGSGSGCRQRSMPIDCPWKHTEPEFLSTGIPDQEELQRIRDRNSSVDVVDMQNIVVREANTGKVYNGSDLVSDCATFTKGEIDLVSDCATFNTKREMTGWLHGHVESDLDIGGFHCGRNRAFTADTQNSSCSDISFTRERF